MLKPWGLWVVFLEGAKQTSRSTGEQVLLLARYRLSGFTFCFVFVFFCFSVDAWPRNHACPAAFPRLWAPYCAQKSLPPPSWPGTAVVLLVHAKHLGLLTRWLQGRAESAQEQLRGEMKELPLQRRIKARQWPGCEAGFCGGRTKEFGL